MKKTVYILNLYLIEWYVTESVSGVDHNYNKYDI